MKKSIFVLLCLAFIPLSFLFTGCDNKNPISIEHQYDNQGFTHVCSIDYLDERNNLQTIRSYYLLSFDYKEILEEEYTASNLEEWNMYATPSSPKESKPMFEKDNIKNRYLIGQKFKHFTNSDEGHYKFFIREITKIEYQYIYFKVTNNSVLEIIDSYSNSHFQIFTSYFKINYFVN